MPNPWIPTITDWWPSRNLGRDQSAAKNLWKGIVTCPSMEHSAPVTPPHKEPFTCPLISSVFRLWATLLWPAYQLTINFCCLRHINWGHGLLCDVFASNKWADHRAKEMENPREGRYSHHKKRCILCGIKPEFYAQKFMVMQLKRQSKADARNRPSGCLVIFKFN